VLDLDQTAEQRAAFITGSGITAMHLLRLNIILLVLLLATGRAFAEPSAALVFDFELADQGIIGATEGDRARLAPLGALLRALLQESGRYRIVPLEPLQAEAARLGELRRCNGCAADLARMAGADVAITGAIQKVSNLILNINVYVLDVRSGRERSYSVDIRGNNDVSFDRGLRFLVKNNMPPP
jgi:hypothetical protein